MELTIATLKTLNNGVEIPLLGLGVFQVASGRAATETIGWALDSGYRHIDTASVYGNESSVGEAVRAAGIPRSEIFITTKLWNTDHGYDHAIQAFNESLRRLDLDYIDLYLVHWPVADVRLDTWRAMETLLAQGRTRAIGVSNYMVGHLEELLDNCSIVPAVNQIELHPYNYLYRYEVIDWCRKNGIAIEAYSPLTRGRRLTDRKLLDLANHYGKSPAQMLVRWALQKDFIVIPKSVSADRISANSQVFDFNLTPRDMDELDSFNENLITSWDPTDIP